MALPAKFEELLELIRAQNVLLVEQSKTLTEQKLEIVDQHRTIKRHTGMLETLEKDVTKDDRAHGSRALDDEQTWGALDKESLMKIKVVVEGWRDLMQISLVFIALFLTVVTAFISPVIAIFTSPSTNDAQSSMAGNSLPPSSTQFIALFYYMTLIVSIFNSVLCVLGMQWAGRLIATPLGKTNLERALARERRKAIADGYLLPLMAVLFWTLLLAIGLFVVGFLIQLWELAFSFGVSSPILIFGGVFATGLSLVILGIIVVTTIHAALHDNSPFESPLSNIMRPILRWTAHIPPLPHGSVADRKAQRKESEVDANHKVFEIPENADLASFGEADGVAALVQWNPTDERDVAALKTYARLVLNTNDADLLERAVPSFEFSKWHEAGPSFRPVFDAIRDRFLATDTSFRVKETLDRQLVYFMEWRGWKSPYGSWWRDDLEANDFTRWCKDQCMQLIWKMDGSQRDYFPTFAFFSSLEEDNSTLRLNESEPYEKCVARILCSFDQDGESGDRKAIFESAVSICTTLLRDEASSELSGILAHLDPSSFLRSLVQNPDVWWYQVDALVSFIVKGKEADILDSMSDFLSNIRELTSVTDREDPLPVCQLLELLMSTLPPEYVVPMHFDLSSILSLVSVENQFWRYRTTLIYYLDHGGIQNLSSLHGARRLWEHCLDVMSTLDLDSNMFPEALHFLQQYDACFIPLPTLTQEECDQLASNICSLYQDMQNGDGNRERLPKDYKRPILELLDLGEERKNDVTLRILSSLGRQSFVDLLIWKSGLEWVHAEALISYITKGHEVEILRGLRMPSPSFSQTYRADCLLRDLLAHFVPSLPLDFRLPDVFDIVYLFRMLTRHKRDRHDWRKHADALIFYLDHGAFDAIDDILLYEATTFFKLCTTDSR
ncbi:hypothetical protein SISSUDRAFT_1066158 [Sistotremastrum suecicum HHB10207 ss-3]|uniref:DUF6535 domain-containing protein n=1 Tax=Sistotremastrum suecicum HHB10207 ss-3 TaxID=1314776 RepID=A0A165YNI8_9AGAM|nr:hypothetical protein SISSUDRAFT_1066158 [Sistotremastrum suecicum HHB10207 ss-3]